MMNDVIRKLRPRLLSWLHRSRSGGRMRITLFVRRFSYKEVKNATDGFRRRMYGNPDGVSAYKARFRASEEDVLVKDFGPRDGNDDEFYRQVQLLGRLHHRHVLAVKGFSSGRRRFVVFDEIENGSLKEYLDDPLRTPLNWKTRLQVAIGVAAALEYLLLFSNPPMYPVSISSSTIMLDQNFNAKLSDVGLDSIAKLQSSGSEDGGATESRPGNIVFQLGLLMLELVTGQSAEKGSIDLVKWIQECRSSSSFHRMIDPDLGNSYDSKELRNLLAVARLCIRSRDEPRICIPLIFSKFKERNTRQDFKFR
ncbi:Probable receptor-like protein kinase At1g49730 [Linum perenne]